MDLPWMEDTSILDNLMRAFPGILRLKVGYAGAYPASAYPRQFLDTLYPRNNANRPLYDPEGLCYSFRWPKLTSIHIEGFRWCNGYFLPLLLQSLAQRASTGAPKLDSLVLTFFRYDYPGEDWCLVDSLFQCAFRIFAKESRYTVRLLSHKNF
ncbi:hypothetical protein FKP32DRAFT_1670808 [Trametes sanguinea]|nr:hypothetical protein FKP32DRAFT_1670808 [Trametes sanguinea]